MEYIKGALSLFDVCSNTANIATLPDSFFSKETIIDGIELIKQYNTDVFKIKNDVVEKIIASSNKSITFIIDSQSLKVFDREYEDDPIIVFFEKETTLEKCSAEAIISKAVPLHIEYVSCNICTNVDGIKVCALPYVMSNQFVREMINRVKKTVVDLIVFNNVDIVIDDSFECLEHITARTLSSISNESIIIINKKLDSLHIIGDNIKIIGEDNVKKIEKLTN